MLSGFQQHQGQTQKFNAAPFAGSLAAGPSVTERILGQLSRNISADDFSLPTSGRSSRSYSGQSSPLNTLFVSKFPEFLLSQIESAECKCFMGIFPEIKRVWLTIDNRLILWNYDDGVDFYSFEGMSDIIVTVSLVKPKAGIFHSNIRYLLVVVTCSEIVLFGLSIENGELSLFKTDISLRPDSLILSVIGSENGQIFVGSQDGKLYELQYQSEERFFSRKCNLMCLNYSFLANFVPSFLASKPSALSSLVFDEERNLLFSLSDDTEITMYYRNKFNNSITFLQSKKCRDECKKFGSRNSGVNIDYESIQIIGIHLVASSGRIGKEVGLVAVTSRGYRLFFSVLVRPDGDSGDLELTHIRSLPSLEDERSENIRSIPFTQFETSFYSSGMFFIAGTSVQSGNVLFSSSLDVGKSLKNNSFSEWNSISTSPDRVWAIVEEFSEDKVSINHLVSQVTQFPKKYSILTNNGVYIVSARRPVDALIQLLIQSSGRESAGIRQFLENYTEEQAAAICLAIACGNRFAFGGSNPDFNILVAANNLLTWIGSKSKPLFPELKQNGYDIGRPFVSTHDENMSILFNAAVLYLARLVSRIWNKKLIEIETEKDLLEFKTVSENVQDLLNYLSKFNDTLLPDAMERAQFEALINIVDLTIQGALFILIVSYNGMPELIQKISPDYRNFASSCTFSTLVMSQPGYELVKEFSKTIILDIINKNSNIDVICSNLQGRCPHFFKSEDLKIFKAQELLQQAQVKHEDPFGILQEASRLLIDAAHAINANQLRDIAASYKALGHPEGIIKLAIECGRKSDPSDYSMQYYRNVELNEFSSIYHTRCEFYNVAVDLVHEKIGALPPNIDIHSMSVYLGALFLNVAQEFYQNSLAMKEISKIDDELFMFVFFDYMHSIRQLVYLLRVPEIPYLQVYLTEKQRESVEYGFFLALYLRFHQKYYEAATKFRELAELPRSSLPLDKRISYLSQALNICHSHLVSSDIDPDFIPEIQDLHDVSLVQMEVISELESKHGKSIADNIFDLNSQIFTATELYTICNDYHLEESKLVIFKLCGHQDDELLRQTWKNILSHLTVEEKYAKIVSIGSKLALDETVFQIDLLLFILEEEAYQMRSTDTNPWIAKAFIEAKCSFEDVINVYEQIYDDKKYPFNDRTGQLYIIGEVVEILRSLLTQGTERKSSSETKFIQDKVARFKSLLSVMQQEPKAIQLLGSLQALSSQY